MDIKKILKSYNVDEGIIEELKESITKEIGTDFIPKTQYQKKVQAIDELREKVDDLEAKANIENTDEYKTKYETLQTEYEGFKQNLEDEKVKGSKTSAIKKHLEGLSVDPKMIKLLVKEFDLEKVEVQEDGNIKDWEVLSETVKDYIPVTQTQGNGALKPPVQTPQKSEVNPLANALEKLL